MITTNGENINRALENWREAKIAQNHFQPAEHLDKSVLVRMAADYGLQEASESELEHLDNCPLCLANWSAWRRAYSLAAEGLDETENVNKLRDDDVYLYGFLEAAATTSASISGEAVESSCGSYRLEILSNREDPKKGMIILSSRAKKNSRKITVRDKTGREILSGKLENGKLARLHHNLDEIDLSIWTVIAS